MWIITNNPSKINVLIYYNSFASKLKKNPYLSTFTDCQNGIRPLKGGAHRPSVKQAADMSDQQQDTMASIADQMYELAINKEQKSCQPEKNSTFWSVSAEDESSQQQVSEETQPIPRDSSYTPHEYGARTGPPLHFSLPHMTVVGAGYTSLQDKGHPQRLSSQTKLSSCAAPFYQSSTKTQPVPHHHHPSQRSEFQDSRPAVQDTSYIPNEFGARVGPPLLGQSYPPFTAGSSNEHFLPNILNNGTPTTAKSLYASSQSSATTVTFSTATSTIVYRPQWNWETPVQDKPKCTIASGWTRLVVYCHDECLVYLCQISFR